MENNSVPQIQVKDSRALSPEQKAILHTYIEEVIQERPELDPEELGDLLLSRLHTVAAFNHLEEDLEAFKKNFIEALHIAMHAQATNFATTTTEALKAELKEEYKTYLEANKMSGLTKVLLVGGTLTVAGGVYYLGRRNGRAIGQLENV